jgi:two-component system invasion response regulator UvrY
MQTEKRITKPKRATAPEAAVVRIGTQPAPQASDPLPARPLRVLIVDDHPMMRIGMRLTLTGEFSDAVIGEASTAHEAFEKTSKQEWDVILLDITMPGRSGLDALKDLKQANPRLPILVISVHSEEQFAIRVMQKGAAGYLTKETAASELVDAVKRVIAGGRYIRPSVAEKLAAHVHRGTDSPLHESLSDREYQVMCMLALGKTVKEIAGELSLSIKTISTYRTRILAKTSIKNNSELMRYAVENELVDFPRRVRAED